MRSPSATERALVARAAELLLVLSRSRPCSRGAGTRRSGPATLSPFLRSQTMPSRTLILARPGVDLLADHRHRDRRRRRASTELRDAHPAALLARCYAAAGRSRTLRPAFSEHRADHGTARRDNRAQKRAAGLQTLRNPMWHPSFHPYQYPAARGIRLKSADPCTDFAAARDTRAGPAGPRSDHDSCTFARAGVSARHELEAQQDTRRPGAIVCLALGGCAASVPQGSYGVTARRPARRRSLRRRGDQGLPRHLPARAFRVRARRRPGAGVRYAAVRSHARPGQPLDLALGGTRRATTRPRSIAISDRIERWYVARGYYDAKVTSASLHKNEEDREVAVEVHVKEGEPVLVVRVAITGIATLEPGAAAARAARGAAHARRAVRRGALRQEQARGARDAAGSVVREGTGQRQGRRRSG